MASIAEMARQVRQSGAVSTASAGRRSIAEMAQEIRQGTQAGVSGTPAVTATSALSAERDDEGENNGGFLGGLGYLGEKIGLGALSFFEGIWDFSAGFIADLVGADDWAEQQVANDWVNYNHADEWFDPGKGWKMAGDVAQGIGNSVPSLVIHGIAAAATGGLSLGASAALTFATSGLSAAGQNVKEAYRETGELGGKEWLFGAASGAMEGAIEAFTDDVLGWGTGTVKKAFGKDMVSSLTRDGLGKTLLKSFGGEALEEAVSTYFTPFIKRMTYDKDAEGASAKDILYAATIGGLSGMLMGGTGKVLSNTAHTVRGANIAKKGQADSLIATAREYVETAEKGEVEADAFTYLKQALDTVEKSRGAESGPSGTAEGSVGFDTFAQKKALGELEQAVTAAVYQPFLYNEATAIVQNPEVFAESVNRYFSNMDTGEKISVSAEELTAGIDFSSKRSFRKSLPKALQTNEKLRTLTVLQTANRLSMDTESYAAAFGDGTMAEEMINDQNLNHFIAGATQAQKNAVGTALGVADWDTATAREVNEKYREFLERGGAEQAVAQKKAREALLAIDEGKAKGKVPASIRLQKDGARRYIEGGVDVGIYKDGDGYYAHDYTDGVSSKRLDRAGAQEFLNNVRKVAAERANRVEAGERMALGKTVDNKPFVEIENDILDGVPEKDWIKTVKNNLSKKFPNGIRLGRNTVKINQSTRKEMTFSKYMKWLKKNDPQAFSDKLRATDNVDEILQATTDWVNEGLNHPRSDSITDFARGTVLIKVGQRDYSAEVVVGSTNDGSMMMYDIINLTPTTITKKIETRSAIAGDPSREANRRTQRLSDNSIPQSGEKSNSFSEKNSENVAERSALHQNEAKNAAEEAENTAKTQAEGKSESEEKRSTGDIAIDVWAKEHVPHYKELSGSARQTVRATIRQARAHGFSEAEVKTFASVAAHSGLRIVFDTVSADQGDALYDGSNTIYIDPNAPVERRCERLLLHEGWHAVFVNRIKKSAKLFRKALKQADPDLAKQITDQYTERYEERKTPKEIYAPVIDEEIVAGHIEEILGHEGVWEYILAEDPKTADGWLDYFRRSAREYSTLHALPAEARRLARKYKKMFEAFSAQNRGNNAAMAPKVGALRDDERAAMGAVNANYADYDKPITEKDVDVLRSIGKKSVNEFTSEEIKIAQKWAYKFYKEFGVKSPFFRAWFGDWRANSGDGLMLPKIDVFAVIKAGNAVNADTGRKISWNSEAAKESTLNAPKRHKDEIGIIAANMSEIVKSAILLDSAVSIKKSERKLPGTAFMHSFYSMVPIDGHITLVKLFAEEAVSLKSGESFTRAYSLKRIEKVAEFDNGVHLENEGLTESHSTTTYSISDLFAFVKQYDKNFSPKPVHEALLNEDGTPKAFYHGTSNEFYSFQKGHKRTRGRLNFGQGFYFTPSKSMAENYAEGKNARVMECYVALKKPYVVYGTTFDQSDFEAIGDGVTSENVTQRLQALGYDGIIARTYNGKDNPINTVVAFEPTQIKSATNNIGTFDGSNPDIRFALPRGDAKHASSKGSDVFAEGRKQQTSGNLEGDGRSKQKSSDTITMSKGQHLKIKANYHGEKVFDKVKIANALMDIEAVSELKPSTFDALIEELWKGFNGKLGEDGYRLQAEVVWDSIHATILSEAGDYLLDQEYRYKEPALSKMETQITDALNRIIQEARPSIASKQRTETQSLRKQANYWREEHANAVKGNKLRAQIAEKVQSIKNRKLGTFHNVTKFKSDVFKDSIEALTKTQWRGTLYVNTVRKAMAGLAAWYHKDNPMLCSTEDGSGLYVEGIAGKMNDLAALEGESLSVEELQAVLDVITYFDHFAENWNKVFRAGKWVEAEPLANDFIKHLQEASGAKNDKTGLALRLLRSRAFRGYTQFFGDPMTVARMMDGYGDGFYTEMLGELRKAALDAQVAEMEIRTELDAFVKKNKRYLEKARAEEVEYRGKKISKLSLIGLYMTIKRSHAAAGFALSGYKYRDIHGETVRLHGLPGVDEFSTAEELLQAAEGERGLMETLFDKNDKEYIAILEKVYNHDARELKRKRDMERLGFSNVTEGYYYPISRGFRAENVDTDIKGEIEHVSNASFNKSIVQGAKQALSIEPADVVFDRHLRAVCQYAYLSPVIDTYNVLYNLDTGGNLNDPTSVASESETVWRDGNKYFKKLIADIQGIKRGGGDATRILGTLRGSYAKYQLGANPKVWVTQLSSFFAAGSMLDATSIAKGMTVSARDVDKYCSLAKLRDYDNSAAMAQAVLDTASKRAGSRVSRFGDLLMEPIGKVDRFVVTRLFGACQVQVEKDGGPKLGTEENKVAAGEMLTRVILETQQNSIATERSAAMRSGNEIWKTVTMFSADAMKVLGRVIDGLGEVLTLNTRIKNASTEEGAALKPQLKDAKKRLSKALMAFLLQAAAMTGIAELFRFLYNKDRDEDETVGKELVLDTVGNLMGGMPVIRDAYSFVTEGYEVDNYAYSAVNDLLSSAKAFVESFEIFGTEEKSSQDVARSLKNLVNSVGQVTGIPTRNVYNVVYGLTKRVSEKGAYRMDNAFYDKNYRTDLAKALEEGDDDMAAFLLDLTLGEESYGGATGAVKDELLGLLSNGHSVLPRAVPKEYTIDGETVELSEEQQGTVAQYYTEIPATLDALFTRREYKALSQKDRVAAIGYVYDTYRATALTQATGHDFGSGAMRVASVVGIDTVALVQAATRGIESDLDKNGKSIAGSKRKKVVAAISALSIPREQKLLLIAAKGYSLQNGDAGFMSVSTAKRTLLKYILSLSLPKAEREALATLCGFEVRNGKILMSSVA